MKILFTADWHLKLGQKNVPKAWQENRFKLLFEKLHDLEEDVDVVIIGGDIFDKLPSLEEIKLFMEYISGCTKETLIYDGNHEATRKGRTFLTFLADIIHMINPKVTILDGVTIRDDLDMDIIPYTHLKSFKPEDFHNLYLCTHVRGEIPPHVKPEIDLEKLSKWKIVLAGDLHAYSNCQGNILYPGSPVTTSFHRKNVETGVIIFETHTGEHDWISLELPQLIRKTVESEEEMIATDFDHTIYEITGDVLDLAKIDTNNSLVDKKIIVRGDSEKTLNLENLTIQDELALYLKDILDLTPDKVDKVMRVFNDYI